MIRCHLVLHCPSAFANPSGAVPSIVASRLGLLRFYPTARLGLLCFYPTARLGLLRFYATACLGLLCFYPTACLVLLCFYPTAGDNKAIAQPISIMLLGFVGYGGAQVRVLHFRGATPSFCGAYNNPAIVGHVNIAAVAPFLQLNPSLFRFRNKRKLPFICRCRRRACCSARTSRRSDRHSRPSAAQL